MKTVVIHAPFDLMTVFNTTPHDTTKEPMFFGSELGVQQYTSFKYPVFEKLTETQLGFFWRPEEVSLQKDRSDYQTLRPEHKHIFTSNLKRQVMLDSVQGRGPALAFIPHCSLPELESAMTVWGMMEMIHSRSYTHIIKNLYPQPEEVFGTILTDPNILGTASAVTAGYDDFIKSDADKRSLFRAVMNVNILEGVRFYVSFACTFGFGENKVMEGSAKILSLIARDENQHLVITQNIINKWADGSEGPEWKSIYESEIENSRKMFETCVNDEKTWAKYLFKDGSMIGLSEPLLSRYVEWIANRRMKAIGLKPLYDIPAKNNPLPWTDNWLKSKGVQVAPQQTQLETYIIGGIKQDMADDAFSGFEL